MRPEDYMTVGEVADFLRISPRGVRKMIEEKRLAADKIGKIYVVARAALDGIRPRHRSKNGGR